MTGDAVRSSSQSPRLTRRGRLVVLVAMLAIALAVLVVWGPTVRATSRPGEPLPVRPVVVQPGETLWDIASRVDPAGNTGAMVHEIAALNALASTGELQIGQQLAVPLR